MPTISAKNKERYTEFASLYTQGRTLRQIGDQHGVSQEFVRQVLKKYFSMSSKDGGCHVRAQQKKAVKDTYAIRFNRKSNRFYANRLHTKTVLLDADIPVVPKADISRIRDSYWQDKDHFKWLTAIQRRG